MKSLTVPLAAVFLASGLALVATGGANAESVMKQCGDDWKAAKANNTTNGMTWQQFLAQCRTQKESASAPAAAPAAAPAPAPAAAPAPAPAQTYQPKPAPARATGAGEFASEAEAKSHCPTDTVVWVNTKSKSHTYHYPGTRWYGTTKQGAYMCEADATAAGDHASKSRMEKPKQQP
jgi:hypothetical protein